MIFYYISLQVWLAGIIIYSFLKLESEKQNLSTKYDRLNEQYQTLNYQFNEIYEKYKENEKNSNVESRKF